MSDIQVDASPVEINLRFTRGDAVVLPFIIEDVNLEGGTGLAQIRVAKSRNSTLIATMDVTLHNLGTDTVVQCDLPAADNQSFQGTAYWDLQITYAGDPFTFMAGTVTIDPDVSHT